MIPFLTTRAHTEVVYILEHRDVRITDLMVSTLSQMVQL